MEKKRYVYAVIVDISNEARDKMGTDCMGPGLLWGIYTSLEQAQVEAVRAEKRYRFTAVFSPTKVQLNRVFMQTGA